MSGCVSIFPTPSRSTDDLTLANVRRTRRHLAAGEAGNFAGLVRLDTLVSWYTYGNVDRVGKPRVICS